MGSRVEEVEYLGLGVFKHLWGSFGQAPLQDIPGSGAVYTGSGRAALRVILEHCCNKGIFRDRNDEILIPRWLCQSVIQTLQRFCQPTFTVTGNTKAVLAYHQYGFPQKMDIIAEFCSRKGLYLIEDCAHAFYSSFEGQRLGTFGNAAIFSFSKFFPSILGGGLVSGDKELLVYAKSRLADTRYSNLTYLSRWFFELSKDGLFKKISADFQEMVYAKTDAAFRIKNLSLRSVSHELENSALEKRKANYRFILDHFADRPEYFSYLEKEDISPYVVPLFAKSEVLIKIAGNLLKNGFYSGVYHFDVNKNVLEPLFKKCVWLPMHQGVARRSLEKVFTIIRKSDGQ